MWNKKQLDQSLKYLEELSFLEVGVCKQVLTPYMLSYIEKSINVFDKIAYIKTICTYYSDLLLTIFHRIGQN